MLIYREPLPEDCPPESAEEIAGPWIVYRRVWNDPPIDDDFRSQRAENPGREFRGISECRVRGLSVFVKREDLETLLKRPNFGGGQIAQVALYRGAGYIEHTSRHTSHHTWWPLAAYDILAKCQVT